MTHFQDVEAKFFKSSEPVLQTCAWASSQHAQEIPCLATVLALVQWIRMPPCKTVANISPQLPQSKHGIALYCLQCQI